MRIFCLCFLSFALLSATASAEDISSISTPFCVIDKASGPEPTKPLLDAANKGDVDAECTLGSRYFNQRNYEQSYFYFALTILRGAEENTTSIKLVSQYLSPKQVEKLQDQAIHSLTPPPSVGGPIGDPVSDDGPILTPKNVARIREEAEKGGLWAETHLADYYLGPSDHQNYSDGYFWLTLAANNFSDNKMFTGYQDRFRKDAFRGLIAVAPHLSMDEIAAVNAKVHKWKPAAAPMVKP